MPKSAPHRLFALVCATAGLGLSLPAAAQVSPASAGALGLGDAAQYRLTNGKCQDCATPPAALWYFRDDLIAAPLQKSSGLDASKRPQEDVQAWASARQLKAEGSLPSLVWLGSPEVARGRMAEDGRQLTLPEGKRLNFGVVPKIDANLSYYNGDSVRFFAGRKLKARGRTDGDGFIARTLWPEDFALNPSAQAPLANGQNLLALVRADGQERSFAQRLLWSRNGQAATLAGKPVLALVLNGAQGDDDEAHGGHFAVATGRFGPQGEWDNWLVNNFYNLDSVSEKGIIAATIPMDAYQADLNSGQSWYRPSYMLVAVFKSERVPALYQEAIGRVFNHFYRHDFRYNHALSNCAGINMETLRSLGWQIPRLGAESRLKALAALPFMTIKDLSLDSGRKAYDYLTAEQTDLYPFAAFNAAGMDLLQRITTPQGAGSEFERAMAEDLEALVYVRIPQFPSSRAYGQAPVASLAEYMARAPEDRAQWKIVPVPPRPFPAALKDPQAPGEAAPPSSYALAGYAAVLALLLAMVWRRRQRRRAAHSAPIPPAA